MTVEKKLRVYISWYLPYTPATEEALIRIQNDPEARAQWIIEHIRANPLIQFDVFANGEIRES